MWRTRALMIFVAIGLSFGLAASGNQCSHHRGSDCCVSGIGDCRGCDHHLNSTCKSTPCIRLPENQAEGNHAELNSREGKVTEVNYLPGATPATAMVEIKLGPGTNPVLIRLGPTGFLRSNNLSIREGDSLRVTGYWVTGGDGDMLVATQVTAHGRTVRLRDDRGRPSW